MYTIQLYLCYSSLQIMRLRVYIDIVMYWYEIYIIFSSSILVASFCQSRKTDVNHGDLLWSIIIYKVWDMSPILALYWDTCLYACCAYVCIHMYELHDTLSIPI